LKCRRNLHCYEELQYNVITQLSTNFLVFLNKMICSLSWRYQHYRKTICLHLQGRFIWNTGTCLLSCSITMQKTVCPEITGPEQQRKTSKKCGVQSLPSEVTSWSMFPPWVATPKNFRKTWTQNLLRISRIHTHTFTTLEYT